MKWMVHDKKKKELLFRLEEHEIIDEMNYTLNNVININSEVIFD